MNQRQVACFVAKSRQEAGGAAGEGSICECDPHPEQMEGLRAAEQLSTATQVDHLLSAAISKIRGAPQVPAGRNYLLSVRIVL